MRKTRPLVAVALALALAVFVIFLAMVVVPRHPARAQPTAILPTITVTTVTTATAIAIVAYNPTRRSFQICTQTNPIWFAPVNPASMTPVTPAANNGILIAAGACFTPPSLLTASGTSGGMGAAIQAISTGGNAIVSVLEF